MVRLDSSKTTPAKSLSETKFDLDQAVLDKCLSRFSRILERNGEDQAFEYLVTHRFVEKPRLYLYVRPCFASSAGVLISSFCYGLHFMSPWTNS